jgi:hypothetical protein
VMSRSLRTEFDDRSEPMVEVDGPGGPTSGGVDGHGMPAGGT